MESNISVSKRSLVNFFILTLSFSWLFWLPGVLASYNILSTPVPNVVWVVIGAHGPLFASFTLAYRSGGKPAIVDLFRAGFNVRMGAAWWILILGAPAIFAGVAVWISTLVSDFQMDTTLLMQPLMIAPIFLYMFFLGGSVQEEFGWRGYALPHLLRIGTPIVASLILGLIWGVWHVPLFYIAGFSQASMAFGVFLSLSVAFSIIFTWVYIRTKHNVFSALLLHAAINTSMSIFPPIEQRVGGNQMAFTYLMGIYWSVTLVIVVRERSMWFKKVPK